MLKLTIADPVEVPGPDRAHYKKGADGKFHLEIDGLPPESEKLAEFRTNNLALMRERDELKAKYAGIDPEAAKVALANQGQANEAVIGAFKQRAEEMEAAAKKAIEDRDALILRQAVSAAFLAIGGRPEAVDYMVGRAPFQIVDGQVAAKDASVPDVETWLKEQVVSTSFAFHASSGGGAGGGDKPPAKLGVHSNVRQLINPTPQELGAHSKDIAAGKVKVAYTT